MGWHEVINPLDPEKTPMPNETMNENTETQTAAPTEDTPVQQDGAVEDAGVSETEAPIENESQEQSQEAETEEVAEPATDDQPVAVAEKPLAAPTSDRTVAIEKVLQEVLELNKQEKQAALMKAAEKQAAPKGLWKEKLAKAYKPEDANVLSEAIDAAMAERDSEYAQLKSEFNFYKPHIDRMGMDREFQKGADFMLSQGIPQSVVATLRPKVEGMVAAGMRATPEVLYQAAYAEHAMKASKAHATKTLEARKAPVKPAAPTKNTPVSPSKYTPPSNIKDPRERLRWIMDQK